MMINSSIEEKAVEAMIAINAAVQKIRFYPPSSTLTGYSIDEAYKLIIHILNDEDTFVITKTERGFFICGRLLSEKEQNKIQVSSFLELLFSFGFVSIAFEKGFDIQEFSILIEIISEKPEQIEKEGGIHRIFADRGLQYIHLDEDKYISEAKVAREGIFDKKKFEISIQILDTILENEDKQKICQILTNSFIKKDDDFIVMALTHKSADCELGKKLSLNIIKNMDNIKFENVLSKLKDMLDNMIGEAKKSDIRVIQNIYNNMLSSDKGKGFRKKDEHERKAFKEKLNNLLKGDTSSFYDKKFLTSLSEPISQFFVKKNIKAIDVLSDKLSEGLFFDNPEVRSNIAEILSQISERLIDEQQVNILFRTSRKLLRWLKDETNLTPAYEKICIQLKEMCHILIKNNRISECRQVLKLFNLISCGKIIKDEAILNLAKNMLESFDNDAILKPIFEQFQSNDPEKRKQAAEQLIIMGTASAKRLLELLRESQNRSERSRILGVLSNMGYAAIPALKQQIREDAPWYYIRNLILLYGKIGDESHLKTLEPFLNHQEIRVKREALSSICNIGGKKSEEILLSALPSVSDGFKIRIVIALGAVKSQYAVPHFVKLLESISTVQSELRIELAKKICVALANIGTHEAIMALTEIFEQKNKKLLLKKSYNETLKKLAADALTMKGGETLAITKDLDFIDKISQQVPES